ncbi:GbpC/Spa domain-containing protein [Streptococcus pluranimalium]|uniref:GbpC/Spa domain-containing protein n=1 Tax=Streptococcus pluranimalium TaxID=82348 RepID=UPI003BF8AA32
MEQRNQKLRIVSGVLFSSALFMSSQVQAQADTTASPASSTVASPATSLESTSSNIGSAQPITTSGDASLDSSLTRAQTEGVLVVEAPTEVVASASEQAQDYQAQVATVDAVTKQYQTGKAQYLKNEQNYQDYLAKQSQYQKDLATFQAYQKEKAIYDQQMKAYNLEKASYDMAYAEAQGHTTKTGYLPEVLAQNLIFRLEPDAVQTITGKVLSDEQLSKAIKNHVGWIDPGTILGSPKLVTVTSRHKNNSVLMAVGDTVVVDYSDLQHSSFSGHTIKTVRYTYRLVSTSHYSGQVVFQALSDPTVTSFTHVYHKDAKTSSAFDMEMTVQFFDANGKELLPTPENYALTSFASLNSLNGEGEYVGDYNGQFLPINGSTISVQNGRAANFTNIKQIDVVGEWDDKDNPNAYIGAIVGKSTERIRFHFGNSKGSAIWFAFNSDVKVSGGLLTPPKAPVAPKVVMKPLAPKAVTKPVAPLRPIVFYHQVKVVIPKPSQAVRPSKPTKRTTSSPNKAKVSPKPSVATVKVNKVTYQPKPIPVYYTSNTVSPTPTTLSYLKSFSSNIVSQPPKLNPVNKKTSIKKTNSYYIDQLSSEQIDWFRRNIGVYDKKLKDYNISRDEVRALVSYLKDVQKMAIKKYGKNNHNKINHAVANAIAGISYDQSKDQKLVNDFNIIDYTKSKYYTKVTAIIQNSHNNRYKVDLSHMMMPIATSYKSVWWKEFIKTAMSDTSFGRQVPESFFWLNSLVGDFYTNIDQIDRNADNDAYILKKRTNSQSPDLVTNFINLYGKKYNRAYTYQKQFDSNKKKEKQAQIAARFSLGLGAIVAVSLLKKFGSKVVYFVKSIPSKAKQIKNTKVKQITHRLKPAVKVAKRYMKPAVKVVKRYMKPAPKPIKRHLKPAVKIKAIKRYVKPVVKPITYRLKPAIKTVKRYVKPAIRAVKPYIRPVIRAVKPYIRPITRFVKKVFKGRKRKR